jgi:hypothetical protein
MKTFYRIEIPSVMIDTENIEIHPMEVSDEDIEDFMDSEECINEQDALRGIFSEEYESCQQQYYNCLIISNEQLEELKKIIQDY